MTETEIKTRLLTKELVEIFCKGAKLTKRKYSANVDSGYLHDKHPESQIIFFLNIKTNV